MTSPARVAANQANSKKSTGPRTEAGKKKAALNSVKHGMRAETVVLRTENKQEFQEHVDRWMDDWQPASESRRWLVERAAIAAWRCNRCVRDETDRFNKRVNESLSKWDKRRQEEAEFYMSKLAEDPIDVLRSLQRTPEGVLALIAACKSLVQTAADPKDWNDAEMDHQMLLNLFGITPGEDDLKPGQLEWSDPDRMKVCALNLNQSRGMTRISLQLLLTNRPDMAKNPQDLVGMPTTDICTIVIRSTLQARIGELENILTRVDDRFTKRLKSAEAFALKPQSDDALYQRYEAHHEREVRANLNQLMKLETCGADLAGLNRVDEAAALLEAAAALATPPIQAVVAEPAKTSEVPNEPKPAEPVLAEVPNEPNAEAPVHPISDPKTMVAGVVGVSTEPELTRLAS